MMDEIRRENLCRTEAILAELRADSDSDGSEKGVLFGEFARFNEFTEINSMWEGNFLERIAPGAFDRTVAEDLSRVKVLYDHGKDPQLGNKPLGPIRSVASTKTGMAYEVDLIDTDYNNGFVKPALRAGLLGASFRFSVRDDSWHDPDRATKHNPGKLPERTLNDVVLFELGPVTFPAYASATAGMRSQTDEWLMSFMEDPERLIDFTLRNSDAARLAIRGAKAIAAKQPGGRTAHAARTALLQL